MAQASLEFMPSMIASSLLDDPEFRTEYGISANCTLVFGDSECTIQMNSLVEAARSVLAGSSEIIVADINGEDWNILNTTAEPEIPILQIARGERRILLADFTSLSPNTNHRLSYLNRVSSQVNLNEATRNEWMELLRVRPFDDHEYVGFIEDIHENPISKAASFDVQLRSERCTISTLVPSSLKYFTRLVGDADESTTVEEFAMGTGRKFFSQLSSWRAYDGFLYSLFLSSHSSLTCEINIEQISNEDLVRAYVFLERAGDRISQLGAIEVGLRVLPQRPEIETNIARLIQQICDDVAEGPNSGFTLLSGLFILVDGELSHTNTLPAARPFYRRLASFAHASLLFRGLLNTGVEIDRFCEWAHGSRGKQYYLQSLADMRSEPRWNPDLATAAQLRQDFLGRILIAASFFKDNLNSGSLYDLIFGTDNVSVHSQCIFPHSFFPGPLEGGENLVNNVPSDIAEEIISQLGGDEVSASSFFALVNCAHIFGISSSQAELAANALKLGSYRLTKVEDKPQLLGILHGLAAAAASTRNRALANELRILVRHYMRDSQFPVSVDEATTICLLTAACHSDLNEWIEFTGEWLTELAFGDLQGNDGKALHFRIRYLCRIVPELWTSCGRADAALVAYNS